MYIKKRYKKNFLKITTSSLSLFLIGFFLVFSENFKTEWREIFVSANYLSVKDINTDWEIKLWNIILWDFTDKFTYVVQPWDNLSMIATRFWTTVKNIKNVNDLASDVIHKDQRLTISQEEWIIYQMKEDIVLSDFVEKYSLDENSLKSINYISDSSYNLKKWTELFVPISNDLAVEVWLVESEEQVVVQQSAWSFNNSNSWNQSDWSAKIVERWYYNPQVNNWFYAWHCTWYVADQLFREYRPWWGNAKDRYNNAKNAGYKVGQTPTYWSIVVIKYGSGYWTSYWHVAIVRDIDWNSRKILIDEMNYSWRFIVTKRWIDMDSGKITWYIYY